MSGNVDPVVFLLQVLNTLNNAHGGQEGLFFGSVYDHMDKVLRVRKDYEVYFQIERGPSRQHGGRFLMRFQKSKAGVLELLPADGHQGVPEMLEFLGTCGILCSKKDDRTFQMVVLGLVFELTAELHQVHVTSIQTSGSRTSS